MEIKKLLKQDFPMQCFLDKRSKNLIKQISKLKKITFYDKLGTIFDKSIRIKQLVLTYQTK